MMQQKSTVLDLHYIITTPMHKIVILHDYLLKMSNSLSRPIPITVNFGFNTVELTMVE